MKIAVKRLVRDENGRAMLLALILLAVGGLTTTPLLAYMSTGLIAGQVYERRTAEVYAADAGVEDAVWKIQNDVEELPGPPCGGGEPDYWSYNISDVNGKSVAVTITYVDGQTYRVVSTATGNSSGTEIEAYITGESSYGDYGDLLNHIVTCQGEIEQAKKVYLTYPPGSEPVENYAGAWPTPEELMDFYGEDVEGLTPYGSNTIDINGVNQEVGPLYRYGTLTIKNSSDTPATLTLTGTLYITGDTQICYGTSGNKEMTLDLNGQTIFVASSSTGSGQEALKIGDKCNIKGYGTIIAVGDIYFKPQSQITTDPVFVLSVSGKTWLQPNGNIYGAVAGSVEVDLQPGTSLTYPTGGFGDFDLNFLQQMAYSIASWDISPQ
jgi:hypothetical protein